LALLALALTLSSAARAAEPFEGAWVKTVRECSDKDDGPNSLTVIDLKVNLDGKPTPMVEQYENHCRIDRKSTVGNDTTLAVTCFEFWDDFKKKINPRKATIKLSVASKDLLQIDGKQYRRCPEKAASAKAGRASAPVAKAANKPAKGP
jgi:hypothetical protein